MMIVIGSGPAGISAALALLERGCKVTMLDVGLELEKEREQLIEMAEKDPLQWRGFRHTLNRADPIKLSYGSDFPYARVKDYFKLKMGRGVHCLPSFAQGGLSNVWGAFVGYYTENSIKNWPITLGQLSPYYHIINDTLHVASSSLVRAGGYRSSQQAQVLFRHFHKNIGTLTHLGFTFGTASLAVSFNQLNNSCTYCALCQHGCPYRLIYNSAHTLKKLLSHSQFTYVKHVVVKNIQENINEVQVSGIHCQTKEPVSVQGQRVFVACGPVISTVLMLKMKEKKEAVLLDSAHFILPCLMRKRIKQVTQEKLHTLCQLFLTLKTPEVSQHSIHLQIYTYMDHYDEKLRAIFKKCYPIMRFLLQPILDRLIVIQGQLDSADSDKILLHYHDDESVTLTALVNKDTKKVIQRLIKYLRKQSKLLGFFPVSALLKISKIAKSFHYGGSMPMFHHPKNLETDCLGRLSGLHRVHVVDTSIFPSIPAGSITPTMMTNAYRIAMECPL